MAGTDDWSQQDATVTFKCLLACNAVSANSTNGGSGTKSERSKAGTDYERDYSQEPMYAIF